MNQFWRRCICAGATGFVLTAGVAAFGQLPGLGSPGTPSGGTNLVVSETDRLLAQAAILWGTQHREEALVSATAAIQADTNELRGWSVRGWYYAEMGNPTKAAADFTEVIRINSNSVSAWRMRGLELYKLGRFDDALADLHQYIKLAPPAEVQRFWPLGIVAYEAGKYAEALDAFEQYRKTDTNDVEVAVWQFLCVARQRGLERARLSLPRVGPDPRVPMMEIHRLFAGTLDPGEVLRLAAIDTAKPPENAAEKLNRQLFYAHFYVGLYHEAKGDFAPALEQVQQAAYIYRMPDLMGDIARVRAESLRKELAKAPK